MNMSSMVGAVAVAVLLCRAPAAVAQNAAQLTFKAPEDAVVALVDAAGANDTKTLGALFGPDGAKVLSSGDPVMDARDRQVFLAAYAERGQLETDGPTRRILHIGNEDWPFPIPIVQVGQSWRFDTAAGAQEILVRRIGRNELSAIRVCKVYVDAQLEYFNGGRDFHEPGVYAQRIVSSPGKHDGLYWFSDDPDNQSPLGQFAADAADEGYHRAANWTADQSTGVTTPFHGYFYRILTAAGPADHVQNYIVNGVMRSGFALIAFPAQYGVSGVMSFIVNQDNAVFEKDLGPNTLAAAAKIDRYDPSDGWTRVAEQINENEAVQATEQATGQDVGQDNN